MAKANLLLCHTVLIENIAMQILQLLLPIFAIIGVAFLLMNVGYIFKKREFRGSCASNNPMLADKFGTCSVCGRKPEEECKMPEVKKA